MTERTQTTPEPPDWRNDPLESTPPVRGSFPRNRGLRPGPQQVTIIDNSRAPKNGEWTQATYPG